MKKKYLWTIFAAVSLVFLATAQAAPPLTCQDLVSLNWKGDGNISGYNPMPAVFPGGHVNLRVAIPSPDLSGGNGTITVSNNDGYKSWEAYYGKCVIAGGIPSITF